MSKTRIVTMLLTTLLILAAVTLGNAVADGGTRHNTKRCDAQHPLQCRQSVAYWRHEAARARRAVEWQRAQVKLANDQLVGPYVEASAAARLAEAVCIAYLGRQHSCPPPRETMMIGRCESGLQRYDPNPASTADGPHQYLWGTWQSAGFAQFPRTEYLPSFLAIELYGANHARTYSPWAASRYCHHLA